MESQLQKAINVIVRVADPEKIILFGSRARGDYTDDSDYDLLVLKEGIKKQRVLAQKIYLNFEDIGAPVDVVVVESKRFEELKKNPYMIYKEANEFGRIVYEKQ